MDSGVEGPRENPIKEITAQTDRRDFDDVFLGDIDRCPVETESWRETAE